MASSASRSPSHSLEAGDYDDVGILYGLFGTRSLRMDYIIIGPRL